jgi:hypothetical protein
MSMVTQLQFSLAKADLRRAMQLQFSKELEPVRTRVQQENDARNIQMLELLTARI